MAASTELKRPPFIGIDSVVENPPTILGNPLVFTPPHPGVDHNHMSLHVFFVGDEAHRFGTWNPAVTCPAGSAAPPALPETGGNTSPGTFNLLVLALGVGLGLIGVGLFVYQVTTKRPA